MKLYEIAMGSLIVLVQDLLPVEMRDYIHSKKYFWTEMVLTLIFGYAFMLVMAILGGEY